MDFYEQIQNLTEEELERAVIQKIKLLETDAYQKDDYDHIGYNLDYNPQEYHLMEKEIDHFDLDVRCLYPGYIPKGTKMIYGMNYDNIGIASNHGRYYIIDEDDYILEFCKWIQDKEVVDEYELFSYILEFIRDYFGYIETIQREDMFKMIQKTEDTFYDPIKEHKLSWFKGRGNAMCSEYSVLAQNLMLFFGIESFLIIGKQKTGDIRETSHAFNLITFIEKERQETVCALIDYADFTEVLDINFNRIGEAPYLILLDNLDENTIKEFINEEKRLEEADYNYMILEKEAIQLSYSRIRSYYIENKITPDSELTEKCQKEKQMKKTMI